MRRALRVAPKAERQIRKAAAWWLTHRSGAPALFHDELARAFDLMTTEPGVGSRMQDAQFSDVRRIHLYRIHYYLYYRVCGEAVHLLAFWHSSRGSPSGL